MPESEDNDNIEARDLVPAAPVLLLTTRVRSALALALTGLVFLLDVRRLRQSQTGSGWLFSAPFVHGWVLVAVNVFFYGWICWFGFWFIRGTRGRERLFMMGWFAGILLWPLKMIEPQWAIVIKHVATFGLAVALFAALALLLEPPSVVHTTKRADAG